MIAPGLLARHSREIGALLEMGHSPLEALGRVRQRASAPVAGLLQKVEEAVRAGATMGEAFEKQAGAVPEPFLRVVRLGEAAGDLPAALHQVADLLESAEWRRLGIQAGLAYPRFLVTALLVGALALAFLLPRLFDLHEAMYLALPAPTRLAMFLGRLLYNPLAISLLLGSLVGFNALLAGRWGLDALRLHLPILGTWVRRQESVTCLEWLDYLLARRMPLDQALRAAAGATSSPAFRGGVQRVADEVARGSTLAAAPSARVFPAIAVWLMGEAERREFPPGLLGRVGRTLQRETDVTSRRGLALVEPLAILAFGSVVGFLILSFFLPLYQLIGNLG